MRDDVAIYFPCRAPWAADAEFTVVRTGTAAVGLSALFCRPRRRHVKFSSASNADYVEAVHSPRAVGASWSELIAGMATPNGGGVPA
jgi:hypothetical protein